MTPKPAKPRINMAHVEGSGTAATSNRNASGGPVSVMTKSRVSVPTPARKLTACRLLKLSVGSPGAGKEATVVAPFRTIEPELSAPHRAVISVGASVTVKVVRNVMVWRPGVPSALFEIHSDVVLFGA